MSQLARGLAAAMLTAWGHLHEPEAPPATETRDSPQAALPEAELRLIESVAGALRDGLNTIRGFSEILAQDSGARRGAQDAHTASRFILESSEELNRFLANLQDFVRHEQGRLRLAEQQVDAADLVEAALGPCRGAAERADVTIVARLAEGFELRCDPARIRNAIANMVLWAAGLAPPGSVIALRLKELPGAGVVVSVSCRAELPAGGGTDGLFEPRPVADGLSGFSLPVARRVALLHAGDLTAEHEADGQTTLRLVLPPHRVIWPQRADACESRAA
jgi:signal transduction histidine kinase